MRKQKPNRLHIKKLPVNLGMIQAIRLLVRLLAVAFFLLSSIHSGLAPDLNARVQIFSPQVQNTNKRELEVLEKVISDFLNNRTWSANKLQPLQRIALSFVITITSCDISSHFT